MATLPSHSKSPLKSSKRETSPDEPQDLSTDDSSMDVSSDHDNDSSGGQRDQGIFDCYCSCSVSSGAPGPPLPQQQHPVISSTTSSAIPQRLPVKSSR